MRPKVIIFDADDTLWDCQGHFERVMQDLYSLLLPFTGTREKAAAELFATERKNMDALGYGTKAFTLSVMETAMRVGGKSLSITQLYNLQQECYSLLQLPATPLPGVVETLSQLKAEGWRMVLFTKGELKDQERKLYRSCLTRFFSYVEITSDKREQEYRRLARKLHVAPHDTVMVGNSLRSDIAPALAAGAWAVHIPFHVTWELEHHDAISHPRLHSLSHISQLPKLLSTLT